MLFFIYKFNKKAVKSMNKIGPITGTFIDEITYDIPSSNWSAKQWKCDLDNMQEIGIDTLIFIRGGFEGKTIFPSKTIGTPYCDDFAGFILEEASKRNMKVFFGLYISNLNWNNGDFMEETRINKLFIDEVADRYSHYPAFCGWYIPHEAAFDIFNIKDIMRNLSGLCKDRTPNKKVLISPFFKTSITHKTMLFTPEQHYEAWDEIFDYIGKDIDICAFQDGSAHMHSMSDYFRYTKKLCDKYDIEHWVNAETFERDVRQQYYPITFNLLKQRLTMHKEYADKIITFEFSHFLSPQSIYPSAKNLNSLYKDHYLK